MSSLILLGSIVAPSLLMTGGLLLWRFTRALDKRRSPLTVALLNLAGPWRIHCESESRMYSPGGIRRHQRLRRDS